jgi:hypothetical protein
LAGVSCVVKTVVNRSIGGTRYIVGSGVAVAVVTAVIVDTVSKNGTFTGGKYATKNVNATYVAVKVAFVDINTCDTIELVTQITDTIVCSISIDAWTITTVGNYDIVRTALINVDASYHWVDADACVAIVTCAVEANIVVNALSRSASSNDATSVFTFVNVNTGSTIKLGTWITGARVAAVVIVADAVATVCCDDFDGFFSASATSAWAGTMVRVGNVVHVVIGLT